MDKLLVRQSEQRLRDVTRGYRERINRLAIFDPLYEMGRKSGRDQHGNPIDWFSLGLLSLLFFFESMLTRRRQTSAGDLAFYLQSLNRDGPVYADEAGFHKAAREIIDTFRDASGKRKEKQFFNWETMRQEKVYYSLLEVRESDLAQNIQYYTLTERGLELIFATKEYFSEFHLSINQLVLRKQLEKGELNSALREIDEMRVAVEELRRKMQQLNHEVQRNIISHETQQKYMKMLEDTHSRLAREHEEFNELQSFVQASRKKLEYEMSSDKERQAYGLLLEISKELDAVHHLHRTLLDDSITLKRKAIQAAGESLYHAGLTAFNFNQDITSRMVTSPLPFTAARGLVRPFTKLYIEKSWSPMAVFAPQKSGRGDAEEEGGQDARHFLEAGQSHGESNFYSSQRHNFRVISQLVRELLGDSREIRLSRIVREAGQRENFCRLLDHRSFYEFWLLLHQLSPLHLKSLAVDDRSYLVDAIAGSFKGFEVIEVREENVVLRPSPRYQIQEMVLSVDVL